MSKRNLKYLSAVLLLFVFTQMSIASSWDPPVGSDLDWCNPLNWWLGPPGPLDTALINSTEEGAARITAGCYAVAAELIIAQFDYEAEVKVYPGGYLHVYGDVILGNYSGTGTLEINDDVRVDANMTVGFYYDPRGYGVIKMKNGRLNIGGYLSLGDMGGYGTLEMSGGVIDVVGEMEMLNGEIQLDSGIIYAADLFFLDNFDIRGDATVIIWRDLSGVMGHSVDRITACGGQGTVIKEYYTNATVVRTECNCSEADITGDCKVTFADIAMLADDWLDGAN